jgi:hypothetical protein
LVFPTLGGVSIHQIRKDDIEDLLDQIAKGRKGKLKNDEGQPIKGGKTAADRTLALVRKILNWRAAKSKNDDYRAPVLSGLTKVDPSDAVRERTLSDNELRVIWQTASETKGPFGAFVRFLLLTASRRGEASAMTHNEVAEITYNKVDRDRRKLGDVARRKTCSKHCRRSMAVLSFSPPTANTRSRRTASSKSDSTSKCSRSCGSRTPRLGRYQAGDCTICAGLRAAC